MCGDSDLMDDEVEVDMENVSQDRMLTDVDVPAGLTLKTDRVGQFVSYGDEVFIGETVRFDYDGGSGEGERNVLVLKVDDNGLEGLTLERDGAWRRYDDGRIDGEIHIVEPFINVSVAKENEKRIRFDEAGEALLASLSGEQLAALYNEHVALIGNGARFDSATGEVVVELPVIKNEFTIVSDTWFHIRNKNDDRFQVYLYPDDNQIGLHVGNFNEVNVTPEQLRDELVKFLA